MKMKPSKTLRVENQTDAFRDRDRAIMIRCRCIAIHYDRRHNKVTAADIGRIEPAFHSIHRKAQGSLFKVKKLFAQIGTTTNTGGKAKGHLIRVWHIPDQNQRAAQEYLDTAHQEEPLPEIY